MENGFRKEVLSTLSAKLGYEVYVSQKEWTLAIQDMLSDVYANKICNNQDIPREYVISVMVQALYISKKYVA